MEHLKRKIELKLQASVSFTHDELVDIAMQISTGSPSGQDWHIEIDGRAVPSNSDFPSSAIAFQIQKSIAQGLTSGTLTNGFEWKLMKGYTKGA